MGNVNRKATPREMDHLRAMVGRAFPDGVLVMGGHGDYGGHRAPRDHTISFRVRGPDGRFCSNVIWLHPDHILGVTSQSILAMVRRSNGKNGM